MYSIFSLKNGEQPCPKCQGAARGCYWCRRTGKVVQCPFCANNAHELILPHGEDYQCVVCHHTFDRSGQPADEQSPEFSF